MRSLKIFHIYGQTCTCSFHFNNSVLYKYKDVNNQVVNLLRPTETTVSVVYMVVTSTESWVAVFSLPVGHMFLRDIVSNYVGIPLSGAMSPWP